MYINVHWNNEYAKCFASKSTSCLMRSKHSIAACNAMWASQTSSLLSHAFTNATTLACMALHTEGYSWKKASVHRSNKTWTVTLWASRAIFWLTTTECRLYCGSIKIILKNPTFSAKGKYDFKWILILWGLRNNYWNFQRMYSKLHMKGLFWR